MQRHSRGIAATALVAMLLPFVAGALGTATAISSMYWAVFLFAVVVAVITWRVLSSDSEEDLSGPARRGRHSLDPVEPAAAA